MNSSSSSETSTALGWLTPGRFACLLGVFVLATFPEILFGLRTFIYRDFGIFGYPLAGYHRESFWRGEFPLWNPYSECGLPFLAQWNTLCLYPLSLIYLLMPMPWSLNFFCLFHFFLAGMGMFMLVRSWTKNSMAAAVAGIAFSFNGLTLSSLMWPNNIAALGLMPWVVWAARYGWFRGGRPLLGAAGIGAMQMLSGAPEVILFTWWIVGGLWILDVIRGEVKRGQLLYRIVGLGLIVIGLCAPQLFPFLDLLTHSDRPSGVDTSAWPMPWWGWANFLVPLFGLRQASNGIFFQPNQGWTSSYYSGAGVLVLALAILIRSRRGEIALLSIFLFVSLALAAGDQTQLYGWARHVLPLANVMRFPIKYVIIPCFALPLLAGFATREIVGVPRELRTLTPRFTGRLCAVLALIMAGIVVFAIQLPVNDISWKPAGWSALTRLAFLVLIPLGCYWLPRARRIREILLALAIMILIWLDAVTHAPRQNPEVTTEVLVHSVFDAQPFDPRPTLGESRAAMTPHGEVLAYPVKMQNPAENFLLLRLWLFGNANLLDRVPKIDGFYSLYLPRQRELRFCFFDTNSQPRIGLVDFLGVCQVTSNDKPFEWEARPTAKPLISFGARPVPMDPANTFRAIQSTDFNSSETVYLPMETSGQLRNTNAATGRVVSQTWSTQQIQVEVDAQDAGMLVFAQSHYHPWHAKIDGATRPIWRANYAYQAVEVPAGRHHVTLTYEDAWFRRGWIVAGITLAIVLLLLMLVRRPESPLDSPACG